ncbi:hypothetical protein [Pantoea dispersa]|uniref:hypothetical protein n=1 Tax=Pantoea dispersa TaxID=59814 RepID=UPI0013316AD7|nr:hypothetical protein [Pantoea dispersa]KAF0854971.1 hypothetical protein Y788_13450 [Pantoea dispersa 625]
MEYIKKKLVMDIGNQDDLSNSLSMYTIFHHLIPEYKFVFSSPKGPYPGFQSNMKFKNGASIRSLFNDENVIVMDPDTIGEMFGEGVSTFKIDYSISLDSQALSYLQPYINGKKAGLDDDIEEIFKFISHENTQVDSVLYEIENLKNMDDSSNHHKIFDKLLGYEFIKKFDTYKFYQTGCLSSKMSKAELLLNTDRHFGNMLRKNKNEEFRKAILERYNHIYIYLLKISIIQISSPSRSFKNKMLDIFRFAHDKACFFAVRELIVAAEFFEKGTDFKFFNKIHKNSKNIWQALRGMTWDLVHYRYLEQAITFNMGNGERYFFPGLLTCDKGFIEVMELTSLKAVAFNSNGGPPIPFFHSKDMEKITANIPELYNFHSKLSTKENVEKRESMRNSIDYNLTSLVIELETELATVSNVACPKYLT